MWEPCGETRYFHCFEKIDIIYQMIHKFSDYLSVDDGVSLEDFLTPKTNYSSMFNEKQNELGNTSWTNFKMPRFFDEGVKIKIQDTWYDSMPLSVIARTPGADGYYRAIYIQINYTTGEYYIGKINADKLYRLLKYKGSGVKFKAKYEKHKDRFARYFICRCKTAKETEELESRIVNQDILKDPFCLNIVQGGGGTSEAPFSIYRKEQQSEYMKEHPERYEAMLKAAHSFDRKKIEERNAKIKAANSTDEKKKEMSERIKNWRRNNPDEYRKSRENNKKAINNPLVKAKGAASRKKWRAEHPEETALWEQRRLESLRNPETNKKRGSSLKKWNESHPKEKMARTQKMIETRRKNTPGVAMIDLESGKILRSFETPKDAGEWVLQNGYTKSVNPSSHICEVCAKKKIPGHGTKKTAYGFGWEFVQKQ